MSQRHIPLPPAVTGDRRTLEGRAGPLSDYAAGSFASAREQQPGPLLLIHSVNAAASAFEVRPLYEHYRARRTVYAPDLPGYGFSDRSDREYTPRLMTDAIHAMVEEMRRIHGPAPIDALAVSLSSEFLARAADEAPESFRTVALVSPTGFDRRAPRYGLPGSDRGVPLLHRFFTFPLWGQRIFDLLTTRPSIRFFLDKTWGSKEIDAELLDYDCLTTRQPGAKHAPYYFLSGFLFSDDISRVYESLAMPVWMVHGERGDFVDYRYKRALEPKPNWTFRVFSTGALPYFEVLDEFTRSYDEFLAAAAPRVRC